MTNNPLCQRLDLAAPVYGKMKRIRVYLFDEPDTCNVLNINPRNCRNWTEILKHITETIKPAFGAVLRLYELASDKFVETFDELILNETYVALGAYGTVKKEPGMYTLSNKRENFKPRERTQLYLGEIDPRMLDFLNETEKKGLTVIYVMTNGVSLQVPQKVVFRKHELQNWDPIIRFLDQKLDIPEGVEHISTIFGDILLEPRELQHGFVYVAIQPLKPFVELDYLELFKYLCSNYRGNYILSIEPAPIQTSELVRRRTLSEPHPNLRMSEFDIEPRKSRASERKLSTFSKRGSTRDSSLIPKRASTPDKRLTTTSNRMRSLSRSIPFNEKDSSDSLGSRKSTISQTEDNPPRKSVQSTGRQSSPRISEFKINPSTNKSRASISARVSYESKKGRSTSKLGPFLPEKGPEDEWEDELAEVYPMESTVEDKTRSRVSKTRASQTAKHSKSSGILNEDISPKRKATLVITNDIDDNESEHVKPSMYRRGTTYVEPQPSQSVNKSPTSCPVFRDCDCPEKELNPMLVTSDDYPRRSSTKAPTSCPVFRNCDCSDESDTNSISAAPSDIKQRRSTSKSIVSKLSEKKLNKAGSIASARGDENRTSRSNRMSSSTVGIESDEDFSDTDSVNKEERTTQISRTSQISKGDFRQSTLSTEGFYIEAATSNNRPSENSPAYCPTYKECDCSNISDDFATQTDSRNTSEYPAYQSFSFECNCPEDTMDPILKSCSINPGQKMSRASIMSRQPDERKRRSTKSRQGRRKSSVPKSCSSKKRKQSTKQIEESSSDLEIIQIEYNAPDIYDETTEDVGIPDNISFDYEFDKDMNRRATLQSIRRASSKFPAPVDDIYFDDSAILTNTPGRNSIKPRASQISKSRRSVSKYSTLNIPTENYEDNTEQTDTRRSTIMSRSFAADQPLEEPELVEYPSRITDSRRSIMKPRSSQVSQARKRSSRILAPTLRIASDEDDYNTEQFGRGSSRRSTVKSTRRSSCKTPIDGSRRSIIKTRKSLANNDQDKLPTFSVSIKDCECDDYSEQIQDTRRSTVKAEGRESSSPTPDENNRAGLGTIISIPSEISSMQVANFENVNIMEQISSDDSALNEDETNMVISRPSMVSPTQRRSTTSKPRPSQILQDQRRRSSKSPAALERENMVQGNESRRSVLKSRPSQILQEQRRRSSKSPAALECEDMEQRDDTRRSVYKTRPSQILQDQRRRSSKSPAALEREDIEQGDESRRSVFKSRPSQILQEQRRRSSRSPAVLEREETEQEDETRRSVYKSRPSQILQEQRRRSSKSPAALEREDMEQGDESRRSVFKSRPSQMLQEQRRRSSKSPAALEREDIEQGDESRRSVFKSRPSQMLQEQRRRSSKSPAALEREDIEQGDESRRSVFKSRPSQILQEQRRRSSRSPAVLEREETEQEDETRRSVYKSRPSQILQEQRRRSSKSPAALEREIMVQGNESRRSVLKSRPSQILQEQRRRSSKYPAALEIEDMEQGDESRRSVFKSRASQILQEQRRRSSKSPAALEREDIEQNDQSRRSVYKSRPSQMLQEQRRRSSKSPAALEREDIEQGQSRRSVFKSRPSQMLQEQRRRSSKPPTALEREDIEQDQSRRSVYKSRPSQILQEQRRRSSRSPAALEHEDMEQGNETRRSIFRSRPSQISQAQRRSMNLSRISTPPVENDDFEEGLIQTDAPRRSTCKPQKPRGSKSPVTSISLDEYEFNENTEPAPDTRRSTTKSRLSRISQAKRLSSYVNPISNLLTEKEDGNIIEQTSRNINSTLPSSSEFPNDCECNNDTEDPVDTRRNNKKFRKSQIPQDQRRSIRKSRVSGLPIENDEIEEDIIQTDATSTLQPERRSSRKPPAIDDFSDEYEPELDTSSRQSIKFRQSLLSQTKRPSSTAATFYPPLENINQTHRRTTSTSLSTGGSVDDYGFDETGGSRRSMIKSRPSIVSQTSRRSTNKIPVSRLSVLEREDIEQGDESRRSVFKSRPSQILQEQRRRSSKSPAALEREDIDQGDESRRSVFKSRPSQILEEQRRRSSKSPAALEREYTEQEDETRRSIYKSRPSQILQEQRRRSSKSPAALKREDMEQGNESRRSVFKSRPSQMLQEQRRRSSKSPAVLDREYTEQEDESRHSVYKTRPSQILQEQRRRSSKPPAALEREDIEQGDESRRSVFKSRPSQILQEQRRRSSKSPAALEREDIEQGDESRRSVFKSRPSQILQEQRRRSSKSPAALEREEIEQGDESRRSVFKSRPSQILQELRRRSSKSPAALEREEIEQEDETRRSVYKTRPSQILQNQRRKSSPATLEREDIEQEDGNRRSIYKTIPSQIFQDQRRKSSKSPVSGLIPDDFDIDSIDTEEAVDTRRTTIKSRQSQISQAKRLSCKVSSPFSSPIENRDSGDITSNTTNSSSSPSTNSDESGFHGDTEQAIDSRRSIIKSRTSQISQAQRRSTNKVPICRFPAENCENEDGSDGKYLAIDSFRKEDTSTRRSTNKSQIIQDPTRRLSKSPNSKLFSDSISRRSTVQSQPSFVSSNLQCFCLSEKSLVPSKNCECIENILKVNSDSCNSQQSNSTPNCSTDINEFQRRGVVTFCSSNISQNPERDCSNVFASSCNNNDGISPMNHLSQISINKCPNFADPSPLQDCGCNYTCGRIDERRSSKRNSSQDSHNNDPATCPVPVDCPGGPTKPIISSGSTFQSCNCAENVYNISPSLSEQLDFVTRNCVDGRKNNDCAEDQAVNHCCNQLKKVTEIDKSASCPLVSFTIFCKDQWSSKSSEVGICPCQTSTSIANQNVPKQNRSCCCWLATNENRRPNAEISCIKQNTCRTTNRNQCSKFRNTNENQQISPCFKSHNELWYCFNQDIDNKCTKGINFNKQDNTICKCNQRLLSYSQNSICPSQNISCYCGKCKNEKLTSPEKICKPLCNQDIVLKLQFSCNEQEKKTVQKVEPIPCNCKEIPIVSESESESQEELEPEPEPEMEPKFEAVPILEFEEEPEAEFEQELDLEPEPEPKEELEIDMEPEFEEERDAELEQELDLEPEPEPNEELEIEMEPEFEELEPELDEAPKFETQRISNKGPMPAMTTSRAYIKTVTKTSCTCCRHLCCGCSVRYFKCGW